MENNSADALSTSTAPLTWHDFLERMRQPSAAEFVKAIKSFIVSFSNNAPDPERDSAAVQQFLASMEAAFRAHPLWAGCSEEELESAGEGLEKYVMTKLFTRCFASLPDDVKADEQLSEKMALVQQFIRPEHLDIQPTFQNETSWLLAQKELQKINMHKAPREKLVCILSCCKVITNLLVNASIAMNENPPGADVFIPVLIFVTIKANPPHLHSNLLYIQRYRRQTRLVAEAAYFFTGMLSAESFISNIHAESLSMEESEFERNMESARALISGLSSYFENNTSTTVPQDYGKQVSTPKEKASGKGSRAASQSSNTRSRSKDEPQGEDQISIKKNLSVSDLEEKGAKMLLKEEQNVFQEFPYVFANVGDLTLNDVEDLLNNYKQLVLKYVCLSKGMGLGVAPDSHLPQATQAETQSQTENDRLSEEDRTIIGDINTHESHDRVEDGLNELSHLESDSSESKQEEGGTATVLSEEECSEATSLPSQEQLGVTQ
ncbi:Vacuolar protein sorting-associated protein 9A-like protein [Drosera capensis]